MNCPRIKLSDLLLVSYYSPKQCRKGQWSNIFLRGNFDIFFLYSTLLHLPESDSIVSEDVAFEPRTFATLALALTTRLDLIFADSLDLILGEIWWRKICRFVQPMGSKDLLP